MTDMNNTEEWLRYIESQMVMQKYKAKGYSYQTGSLDQKEQEES